MLHIWKFECNQNVTKYYKSITNATKVLQSVKVLFWIKKAWVKRKLEKTKLIQNCQIIWQIEKRMTNKEASQKFGAQK